VRTDCPACTDLFSLRPGQVLHSPRTGQPWFRSTGQRKLRRADLAETRHSGIRRTGSIENTNQLRWWIVAIIGISICVWLHLLVS